MDEKTHKKFNEELKKLLKKYNCTLQIAQNIQVAQLPEEKKDDN